MSGSNSSDRGLHPDLVAEVCRTGAFDGPTPPGKCVAGKGVGEKVGFGPYLMDPIGFVMSKMMLRKEARRRRLALSHTAGVDDRDNVACVSHGHAPFAVFNRTANPVVKMLLRSRLHRSLSGGLALITVTGRRSGRRYTFPVGYRQDGDQVTVKVGWPQRKDWWRNLRQGGQVEMQIRGQRRVGLAHAHGDERTGVTVQVQLDPNLGG